MNSWDEFKQALVGKRIKVVRREYDWIFDFGDHNSVSIACLWRLRDANGIRLTSEDQGHQFGLSAPLDVEQETNEYLGNSTMESLDDSDVWPDFILRFSNGSTVEVIADSAGYENWLASYGEVIIVGRCGD